MLKYNFITIGLNNTRYISAKQKKVMFYCKICGFKFYHNISVRQTVFYSGKCPVCEAELKWKEM